MSEKGGERRGCSAQDNQRIRSDSVLRVFVRDAELEEGDGVKTEDGRVVRMSHQNKRSLVD